MIFLGERAASQKQKKEGGVKMESSKKQAVRESYHRPQVRDYGNVKDITKTVGAGTFNDGHANKTH
jgi:hypothetical protein